MSDKRSVHTDALATLGTIIDETGKRDAIHLAVEPVIAGERLEPGWHIGIEDGRAYAKRDCKKLGIVDPFIAQPIEEGERFWLIVYPRQISSLRHVWEHPDFQPESTDRNNKQASIEWMTKWARKYMSDDYYGQYDDDRVPDDVALSNAIRAGQTNHLGPYEGANDAIDDEWWEHWEAITGLNGNREGYFSCSC